LTPSSVCSGCSTSSSAIARPANRTTERRGGWRVGFWGWPLQSRPDRSDASHRRRNPRPTHRHPAPTAAPTEPSAPALPADATPLDGQWEGAIDIAGQQLGIIVKFDSSTGALTATIDIPQQGAADLPRRRPPRRRRVHFAIGSVGAEFDGTIDGQTIGGDFARRGHGTFEMTARVT
jgi:hypothetical protein